MARNEETENTLGEVLTGILIGFNTIFLPYIIAF